MRQWARSGVMPIDLKLQMINEMKSLRQKRKLRQTQKTIRITSLFFQEAGTTVETAKTKKTLKHWKRKFRTMG